MTLDPTRSTAAPASGSVVLSAAATGALQRDAVEASVPAAVGTVATSRLTEGAIRALDVFGAAVLLVLLAPLLRSWRR